MTNDQLNDKITRLRRINLALKALTLDLLEPKVLTWDWRNPENSVFWMWSNHIYIHLNDSNN